VRVGLASAPVLACGSRALWRETGSLQKRHCDALLRIHMYKGPTESLVSLRPKQVEIRDDATHSLQFRRPVCAGQIARGTARVALLFSRSQRRAGSRDDNRWARRYCPTHYYAVHCAIFRVHSSDVAPRFEDREQRYCRAGRMRMYGVAQLLALPAFYGY
jgi:hypothetical protein